MKNRKREICTSGTVRDADGNILIYSANDREDRGNVGIIEARSAPRSYPTAVVPAHLDPTTAPARRFFERRRSVITRAFGSPKIPRTVG